MNLSSNVNLAAAANRSFLPTVSKCTFESIQEKNLSAVKFAKMLSAPSTGSMRIDGSTVGTLSTVIRMDVKNFLLQGLQSTKKQMF